MTKHRKLRKRIDKLMPERGVETRRWFVLDAVPTTLDGEPITEHRLRGGKRAERMLALIEQGDPRAGGMGAVIWHVLPPPPEFAEERAATLARRARAQHDEAADAPEPDEFPDAYVIHDGQPTVAPGLRRAQEWARARRIIDRQTSAPGLDSPRSAERAGRRIECRVIPLLTPGTRRK